jgi:hypothetical protein
MTTIVAYDIDVTPKGFNGLTPLYEVSLYRRVRAGVCGPFSEAVTVEGFGAIDKAVNAMGYKRTGEFGPVCANGFATAPAEPL